MPTFFNQATLTYNGNTINSNITTGELVDALTVTKTAVIDTYTRDSEVTYVVSIVNTGGAAITGVTVTDDLGEYDFNGTTLVPLTYVEDSVTLFVNGVLQANPAVDAGPSLVISGLTIPAGGVVTLIYVARVNEFAPLDAGRTIVNRAVVTGSCADVEDTATITVRAEADLTITKSLTPATVTCGGSLTYTFVIQYSGSSTSMTPVPDTQVESVAGETVYYDQYGNVISEEESLRATLIGQDETVLCEYIDRNKSVVRIQHGGTKEDLLPISVITRDSLRIGQAKASVIQTAITLLYPIELLVFFVIYLRKRIRV